MLQIEECEWQKVLDRFEAKNKQLEREKEKTAIIAKELKKVKEELKRTQKQLEIEKCTNKTVLEEVSAILSKIDRTMMINKVRTITANELDVRV